MIKRITNKIRQWFDSKRGTGALVDDRPKEQQLKDYRLEEIVAGIDPVEWEEKDKKDWRKFPIFDQNGSGSCVAQTLAKLLGILYWLKNGIYVHFSATHIYQRRANKPNGGMAGTDALDIAREGVTLEVLVPSQKMTDEQMDTTVIPPYKEDVGKIFKVPNYVVFPIKDIDTIASTIQKTHKGVMVWFYFMRSEWTDVPTIKDLSLPPVGSRTVRHSVTAVDFTLYKGKKALIIEDSWGDHYGLNGQRVITEDFFKARNFFAAYPIDFKFEKYVEKTPEEGELIVQPRYTFTTPLEFTEHVTYSRDVVALQNILKYEGLFPKNVESTGYYGAITAKAVYQFQKKYQVASDAELDALQGRRVGSKTIAKLNELYGA